MRQEIIVTIFYILGGYVLGSILFAPLIVRKLRRIDLYAVSTDGNPGTANAYMQGGFWCGTLSLICDMGKGFLPVFLYLQQASEQQYLLVPVMLAPVLGHAYSLFHQFQGGKCIAVSFGVLIGLFPDLRVALILAFFYILFSFLRIQPHSRRTFAAFVAASIYAVLMISQKSVVVALCLMSFVVLHKHAMCEHEHADV